MFLIGLPLSIILLTPSKGGASSGETAREGSRVQSSQFLSTSRKFLVPEKVMKSLVVSWAWGHTFLIQISTFFRVIHVSFYKKL